jgi:RimJ/RimL family protein N-acetyltransferase
MAMHLMTERLSLRPWAESDVENYRTLVIERGDGRPTDEEIRERISSQLATTSRTGIALLAVSRQQEGDFIGYCGLIPGRACVAEPEIAYELYRRVHGNGYATEAARAVLRAAAATGRVRVWATVRSWNAASFRVLDKLGFERDHVSVDERGELVWLTRSLP